MKEGKSLQNGSDNVWQPPLRFTRDTTKFWLKPEDVLSFKCETIKHLPILIFNRRGRFLQGNEPLCSFQARSNASKYCHCHGDLRRMARLKKILFCLLIRNVIAILNSAQEQVQAIW